MLIGAGLFFYWGMHEEKQSIKNIKDMHSIIISDDSEITNKKSYININTIPYKFAIYDGIEEAYYFVADENYMYVVFMGESDFLRLSTASEKKPIKIEGTTKETPSDIRKIAIEVYNDSIENEEDKLLDSDFEAYFGSIYLDLTNNSNNAGEAQTIMSLILLGVGIFILIYERINHHRFNKNIKNLDASTLLKLDSEMNASNAFYYQAAHLYLTENYVINFSGTFRAIPYQDIVWLYPYEYRVNGIKTNQSIIAVTKDGKKNNIANIDIVTKKKKEAYDEIFNTIASKNDSIILGYSTEARKKAQETLNKYKIK